MLDAKDQKLDPTVKRLTPNSRIYAKVVGGSKEHGTKHPDIVSADIFVDGVQRYRVQNIRVRGVSGGYLLVANGNFFEIVYYLEDGLQLNIDGQGVYWEQLRWSVWEP